MNQRYSPHSSFFSSLRQVEKRLKTETPSESSLPLPTTALSNHTHDGDDVEPLSSPIYLGFDLEQPNNSSSFGDSHPPREFLEVPQRHEQAFHLSKGETEDDKGETDDDDIERLIQLLDCVSNNVDDGGGGGGEHSVCEDGFYANVVGLKGPKCSKEVGRLEGWIKHFFSSGTAGGGGGGGGKEEEKTKEPLRLAHLLLGKASICFSEGLEFPPTVEDFLHIDPPTD